MEPDAILQQACDLYEKTQDEDVVEQYMLSVINSIGVENTDMLKDHLLSATLALKTSKRNKKILQDIIRESLWTAKLQREIQKSDIPEKMKKLSQKYTGR